MRYDWQTLSDGVHRCRLPFLDVTVGLVHGSRNVLLIDCGTTLLEAAQIADDVAELTGAVVTQVVLTHHHFDHVLGSAGFGGAMIHASAGVVTALTSGLGELRADALGYGADPAQVARAIAATRAPDRVVTSAVLDLGGRLVRVEHPGLGHTDHDLVVVVDPVAPGQRRVVFCGDLVEESADPAIGADSDLDAWPSTLDRVLTLGGPDAIYVPGHGALVDAEFVRVQRQWLAARGAR
ncbi:MBL fold metallo-hydrolase [Mycolicibacterium litorale]|nr:MBL fold metallo-hydrolase [Mycolicibacterium litorale]